MNSKLLWVLIGLFAVVFMAEEERDDYEGAEDNPDEEAAPEPEPEPESEV